MEMTHPAQMQVRHAADKNTTLAPPGLTGLWHLVVHLSQGGRHLVRERSGDDHDVGLSRTGTEDDTETVLVVPRGGHVHHLYGAARETYTPE